jgi:hypothetical protein
MPSPSQTALDSVLRVMRPLARLLLRHGVTYPAFGAALKRVFLEAAQAELAARGMSQTDSAVTLLSGVHRRDVRNLTRGPAPRRAAALEAREPLGLVGQVVARWLSEAALLDAAGAPRRLPRSGAEPNFDALVASVSSDVRPRALLDEMLRLGVASEDEAGVALLAAGFAPRQGLAESAALLAANLHDHAAAAVANLQGEADFIEQALYVDQITADSADALHRAAAAAWKQALKGVMRQAQARFDADAATAPPGERTHRARFGVYFFSEKAP